MATAAEIQSVADQIKANGDKLAADITTAIAAIQAANAANVNPADLDAPLASLTAVADKLATSDSALVAALPAAPTPTP